MTPHFCRVPKWSKASLAKAVLGTPMAAVPGLTIWPQETSKSIFVGQESIPTMADGDPKNGREILSGAVRGQRFLGFAGPRRPIRALIQPRHFRTGPSESQEKSHRGCVGSKEWLC